MIYTLGYANLQALDNTLGRGPLKSLDELQAVVEAHQLLILDIRHRPFSWRPGFSKGALARRFGSAYLHVPGFGNLNHRLLGAPIQLADPAAGLAALERAGVGPDRRAILLCACAAAATCHRTTVARYLEEARGWPVMELDPFTLSNFLLPPATSVAEVARRTVVMLASFRVTLRAIERGLNPEEFSREVDDRSSQAWADFHEIEKALARDLAARDLALQGDTA